MTISPYHLASSSLTEEGAAGFRLAAALFLKKSATTLEEPGECDGAARGVTVALSRVPRISDAPRAAGAVVAAMEAMVPDDYFSGWQLLLRRDGASDPKWWETGMRWGPIGGDLGLWLVVHIDCNLLLRYDWASWGDVADDNLDNGQSWPLIYLVDGRYFFNRKNRKKTFYFRNPFLSKNSSSVSKMCMQASWAH